MLETKFDNVRHGWKRQCEVCGKIFEIDGGVHVALFENDKHLGNLCRSCIDAGPEELPAIARQHSNVRLAEKMESGFASWVTSDEHNKAQDEFYVAAEECSRRAN
jgi:hypothetical protein